MQGPDRKKILVVDPDPAVWRLMQRAGSQHAAVEICSDFASARRVLIQNPPGILVTNLRLGAYNGLHLVYLAVTNGIGTRAIVCGQVVDMSLIREAQSLGAFYESPMRIANAVGSYLNAELPQRDRRQPREFDRRALFRGGRRAADVVAAAS